MEDPKKLLKQIEAQKEILKIKSQECTSLENLARKLESENNRLKRMCDVKQAHIPMNELADEIVAILNEEIYADSDGELSKFIEEYPPLDYMSDGNIVIIRFFETPIWDSDNDTRDMDENGEYTTDLQTHIRRLIRHHIKMISQIDIGGPI